MTTSYNGREVFTVESLQVALWYFSAQALAGIEVYKSGTAEIMEPGSAGLINVRTRRPFYFKDCAIAGGLRGTCTDQNKNYDPSVKNIFSDRCNTGIGEFGLLLNAAYSESKYNQGTR